MQFISDKVDLSCIKVTDFNLIASGTGTGKSYFIGNELINRFPEYKSFEFLFVTSRTFIVDQQSQIEQIEKYDPRNLTYVKQWNGEQDYSYDLEGNGIQIMTYDKIIKILESQNKEGLETLNKLKVIVFDECHTLFSDRFIRDIEMLKVWIRDTLYSGTKVILGLTATPNILMFYQKQWGVSVNRLNNDILVNYKAKQLHCTDFKTIPYIVTTQLQGKTIIMCYSYMDCLKLKEEIPNSFILISKTNPHFTDEMAVVRECIVQNETLPETFTDTDGATRTLDVLITTSTLREGVNLREKSGIKNVICCFTDELHITQFAGRCRFDIDNLIIADTYINSDNFKSNEYLSLCRQYFRKFIDGENHVAWFDSISHLVDHDVYNVKHFTLTSDNLKFINYINKQWLVPKGITDKEELQRYKIYRQEDKQAIIDMAYKSRITKLYKSQITFNKVISIMKDTLGYIVETGREMMEKKQCTYKLIIDFDEDRSNKKESK